jgi:hypothetical protein
MGTRRNTLLLQRNQAVRTVLERFSGRDHSGVSVMGQIAECSAEGWATFKDVRKPGSWQRG